MLAKLNPVSGKQAPVSSHRLFPVVVAIWFAALLGLGSFILPVTLFETFFRVTGISSIFTSAQAPLGMTARLLIAICGAGLGAIAGLLIARKIAGSQNPASGIKAAQARPDRDDRYDEDRATRPISAREELGSESLDEPIRETPFSPPSYNGKRRSLAVTDDSGPSEYLEQAPLPGGDITYDGADTNPYSGPDSDLYSAMPEPLDLGDYAGDDYAGEAEDHHDDNVDNLDDGTGQLGSPFGPPDADPIAEFSPPEEPEEVAHFTAQTPEPAFQETQEPAPMTDFSRPSSSESYNPFASAIAPDSEFEKPFAAPDVEPSAVEPSAVEPSAELPQEPAGVPLDELRTSELVERFARALQAKLSVPETAIETVMVAEAEEAQGEVQPSPMVFRRSSNAGGTAEQPAPEAPETPEVTVPEVTISEEPVAAEIATPEEEPAPPFMPAALAPVGFDDDDDSDEDDYDTGFSSLLNMKSPIAAGREFVRIDDEDEAGDMASGAEPVVIFPGQEGRQASPASDGPAREPVDSQPEPQNIGPRPFDGPSGQAGQGSQKPASNPSETERALREALEKLQRMSGAA